MKKLPGASRRCLLKREMHKDPRPGIFEFDRHSVQYAVGLGLTTGFILSVFRLRQSLHLAGGFRGVGSAKGQHGRLGSFHDGASLHARADCGSDRSDALLTPVCQLTR